MRFSYVHVCDIRERKVLFNAVMILAGNFSTVGTIIVNAFATLVSELITFLLRTLKFSNIHFGMARLNRMYEATK